ncbi:MAG: hypothetical protein ABIQ31_15995 [Ferruginibacter sp.]
MKAFTSTTQFTFENVHHHSTQNLLGGLNTWIKAQEPAWEFNRLGISATGIFIQVTFAAFMIGIVGMAEASPWLYGTGILFAFMANSLTFAQMPMRWILGLMLASIVVNASLGIFFSLQLLA